MTKDELLKEILKLSVDDREFLVHEIWASIGRDMDYYEEFHKKVNQESHVLHEEESEYLNDPMFKFWKGVNEKLTESPAELSQEVKNLLDERMEAIENGTAVLYKWEDVKVELEKRYKK